MANLSSTHGSAIKEGYEEDEDCKWEKRIKYVVDYVPTCCRESREKCEYKTIYKEECADERRKVCEHFWKEDDYGGRVWVPNPDKCHWLEESECMWVPHQQVCYCPEPDEFIHKQVPLQHECEICGGEEKRCLRAESEHHGYKDLPPCPVDCVWSEFKYTNCSNQCGPGVRNGTRSILTPAQHGGKNCTGPSVVTTQCNSDPGGAPSMFEVLKEDTSSLQPCQNREEEIKSCVRVNVDFDTIDASDRLKAFCTSVERKFEAENSNDTRFYEADNFAYLVLTRRNISTADLRGQLGMNRRRRKRQASFTENTRLGYRSIHGTFKIPGNGSYAIENCGRDCHVVVEVTGDNAIHPPYNESNLVTDDSQLPAETQALLQRGEADTTTMATISLVVYYTFEFRDTTPDVQGHIDGLILNTNIAFENSKIPLRFTLHCFLEIDIDVEGATTKERLRQFKERQGGNEERLLQTADFALLLTNTRDADGIGGEVDGVDPLRNPGTFRCGWLAKNKKGAFTHELGHLLGARHDRGEDNPQFNANPEHGYFINNDTRQYQYTIMATGDNTILPSGMIDDGLGRSPYFSAPRMIYNRTLGGRRNDNTAQIIKSRNPR